MDKNKLHDQYRKLKEIRTVRVLALPFVRIESKLHRRKFQRTEDAEFLKTLKNRHVGELCFVIGNGPSLRPEDLDMLASKGIPCFGTNRIYYIYPKTKWRPTYYLCLDQYVVATEFEELRNMGSYPKFINYRYASYGRKPEDNIHYLCRYGGFWVEHTMGTDTLSPDISDHVAKTGTVTANAIEMAIYMGFKEIYLLGVDNNYAKKRTKSGKVQEDKSVASTYFAGMKDSSGGKEDKASIQNVDFMEETYEKSKLFAEERGVKIYNATRGGKLEVFERVDFDELMAKK